MSVISHPVWMRQRFRRYLQYVAAGAVFQAFWASLCFSFIHFHPLAGALWFDEAGSWTISTIFVVYSMVSLTQSFYILITLLMAYLLNSRLWFYTALVFTALPGLIPSLIQTPLALFLWMEINKSEWDHFFSRFDDVRAMKGLTEQSRKQL